MLKVQEKINLLADLGQIIKDGLDQRLEHAILKSHRDNNWFTKEQVEYALQSVAEYYLDKAALSKLILDYAIDERADHKVVGLIPAGNIPLVGFHDMLCVFLSDHYVQIKSSKKDDHLAAALVDILVGFDDRAKAYFTFVDKLAGFDAIIATGSDNSSRYFEYYFKDYPRVIRKNRNGIAVLTGSESDETLTSLGHDVFRYFGLGCRNVSKIYIPKSFDVKRLFTLWNTYDDYINHHKYANNFEYNSANLILSQQEFLTNNVFILKEDKAIVSRISTIHYEYYDEVNDLVKELKQIKESIQCIASDIEITDLPVVPIGEAQKPSLTDFADGVNTLNFLLNL